MSLGPSCLQHTNSRTRHNTSHGPMRHAYRATLESKTKSYTNPRDSLKLHRTQDKNQYKCKPSTPSKHENDASVTLSSASSARSRCAAAGVSADKLHLQVAECRLFPSSGSIACVSRQVVIRRGQLHCQLKPCDYELPDGKAGSTEAHHPHRVMVVVAAEMVVV